MSYSVGAYLPGSTFRPLQIGAVSLPFLALFLFPLRVVAYQSGWMWLIAAVLLLIMVLLVAIGVVGLARGFPLWSLPALGMTLSALSSSLQMIIMVVCNSIIILPRYGEEVWPQGLPFVESTWPMLLVQLLFLVLMAALLVVLLRMAPRFHAQVREEWTLLSFLLYGVGILPILFWSDEFDHVGRYQIASSIALVLGAGLYLVAPRRWQRLLALVIPTTLAFFVMSIGMYQMYPLQTWADHSDNSFRLWYALQPLLNQLPVIILMLLAALAPRLQLAGCVGSTFDTDQFFPQRK